MIKVETLQNNENIYLSKTLSKDAIQIFSYDNKSFEGTTSNLSIEQAKNLINQLQLLIYESEE